MNIKGWFPWGLAAWTSLLSKELSKVFSSTTVWKHQFFSAQHLCGPTLIHTWLLEKPQLWLYRPSLVAGCCLAPVCETLESPTLVIRMSQHSGSALCQPPRRWDSTLDTVPADLTWHPAGTIWLQMMVGGMLGIKTFVTGSSYCHLPTIVKEGTVPKWAYHVKKPELWKFLAISKF